MVGTLAFAPFASLAATPNTPYDPVVVPAPDSQTNARFGDSLAVGSDLNGDGENDLYVAAIRLTVDGIPNAGRVYALSGKTREVLHRIDSPEPQAGALFGFFISAFGDVNGDGISELAVGTDAQDVGTGCGTPEPNACNEDQGMAWVIDGASRNVLYALNNPFPQGSLTNRARFGSRIGAAGDVTGDGRPDVIVGASHNDQPAGCGSTVPLPAGCRVDEGQAFLFNGANGAPVRTLNFPAEDRQPLGGTCTGTCGWFGQSVQSPGDVNGDGVADHQVAAGSYASYTGSGTPCGTPEPNGCNEIQGRMYIFSGASGQLLRKIDHPVPDSQSNFGFQDIAPFSPGDVTGDGRADVYVGASQEGEFGGEGFVFNGQGGGLLYKLFLPDPFVGKHAFAMAKTDYNKDGRPDLYVGWEATNSRPFDQNAGTYVYDGRNGSLLKTMELPEADRQPGNANSVGPYLGWAVGAPGDLNNDGEPDFAATAPQYDEGTVLDVGRLYLFMSRAAPPSPSPPNPGSPAAPAAPFAGCPTLTANVIRGTAAGNNIVGTVRADRIFAGTGNDVVDGLAANDCIDLGPGTDRGQGGSGSDLILGGLGRDRLSGSSGNDRLLGGPSGDRLIGGFENDRLHGQSGADRIHGERGRDRINGGSSNDAISAGSSGDRVAGDQGNDRINGNSGNDSINGNSGRDRLTGGSGRDRISGASGNDRISTRDRQRDRISCGRGTDTVTADRIDRIARDCERVRRR